MTGGTDVDEAPVAAERAAVTVTGAELAALLDGHADTTAGERGGLVPHRLPAWARARCDDPMLGMLERCPAGVVLRFDTTATTVELALATRTVQIDGGPAPRDGVLAVVAGAAPPRLVALPRGDVVKLTAGLQPYGIDAAEPAVVRIAVPAGAVEIWLPHDRSVELLSLSADHPLTPAAADMRWRWTHYGSSISHGIEAHSAIETWPGRVAHTAGWRLRNLSFSGNAVLDPFVAGTIAAEPADLITLKVGINLVNGDVMRRRMLRPLLHGFLDTIRAAQPDTAIVLISAIACPIHEDAPGPTVTRNGVAAAAHRDNELDDGALTLADTRQALADVVAARDDAALTLLDGRELFGTGDAALLYDGLHPTAEGLALIARRFPAALQAALPAVALHAHA